MRIRSLSPLFRAATRDTSAPSGFRAKSFVLKSFGVIKAVTTGAAFGSARHFQSRDQIVVEARPRVQVTNSEAPRHEYRKAQNNQLRAHRLRPSRQPAARAANSRP